MIIRPFFLGLTLVLFAAASLTVAAQGYDTAAKEVEEALHLKPNLENGKSVYMVCTVCHMPEGWGTVDGVYPQIAGQLQSVIIKQLADIRARNRDNPTMRPFTVPELMGGAQEIADVAAYISQLPMNPMNSVGPGRDLSHGEKLYLQYCADCHGDSGEGNEKKHIPKIHGQHFRYLVRQFDWIRVGKRRNADKEMVEQIRGFSPRDEMAVLDYVSRIKPPADKVGAPGWQNPDFPHYTRGPYGPGRDPRAVPGYRPRPKNQP